MTNTETTETTLSVCGLPPGTAIPNCAYCNEPLTSNEFDFEPGSYGSSFYSAHSRCVHGSLEGRYVIDSLCYPTGVVNRRGDGFTTVLRARHELDELVRSNRAEFWKFQIRDRQTNTVILVRAGAL